MNIPTSVIVVLLVVAWLVVLVPMVARRRERVPQVEPAGAGFRVLRRASASLRRRPSRGPKGRMMSTSDRSGDGAPEDLDDIDESEELVAVGADQPADAAEEWAAAQRAQRPRPVRAGSTPLSRVEETRDEATDLDGAGSDDADLDEAEYVEEPTAVRRMVPDEIDRDEWSEHVAAAPAGGSYDVEDVQLRPLPRRTGRGGFDPEAAEATRAYRYQQRRRVALVLLVATVAFTVASLVLVSWLWVGAAISAVLLVGYLGYLRRQVKIEASIRQRRMERLQRARQIRPEYPRPRPRTRGGLSAVAPGRTVVDLDDDDPGFDELEPYHEPMTYRRASGQ
jgi:membrane protein YdbS with pleckstrin-like domain